MNLLITGGAGFIGTNFLKTVKSKRCRKLMVVMDNLAYAANYRQFKRDVYDHPKLKFTNVDIRDARYVEAAFEKYGITHVMHLAEGSHVHDSASNSKKIIETNILGTYNLLEASKKYGVERFHHVSSNEVFQQLNDPKRKDRFTEDSTYAPRSPYSASKASCNHLALSYHRAYGLPVTMSYASNNYGPYQNEAKFVPKIINSILNRKKIPVYGNGKNIRDWIHVQDHCEALWKILTKGKLGESYAIGAECEKMNLEVVYAICDILKVEPDVCVDFVEDKDGHDFRQAMDSKKIRKELRWKPKITFDKGIAKTVSHYKYRYDNEFEDL